MKIERLGHDKIRIFLTYDDLLERGIQKEDMLREPPKLHDLFMELMEQAYNELGFEASGRPLAVEVYAMPAQGMFVVVTRGKRGADSVDSFGEEDELDDDIYDLDVIMEHSDIIMYSFDDFEHIISACKSWCTFSSFYTSCLTDVRRKITFTVNLTFTDPNLDTNLTICSQCFS